MEDQYTLQLQQRFCSASSFLLSTFLLQPLSAEFYHCFLKLLHHRLITKSLLLHTMRMHLALNINIPNTAPCD